jgi:hypothetical protein
MQSQLSASDDLAEVLAGADLVVVGVPSQFYRAVLSSTPKGAIPPDLPVLNLSKGIEQETFQTMTQVLARSGLLALAGKHGLEVPIARGRSRAARREVRQAGRRPPDGAAARGASAHLRSGRGGHPLPLCAVNVSVGN